MVQNLEEIKRTFRNQAVEIFKLMFKENLIALLQFSLQTHCEPPQSQKMFGIPENS